MAASHRPPPTEIDTWIFDLDNTLYAASSGVFDQISRRMTAYVARTLGIDADQALLVQKDLFRRYGTTMRGMMLLHDIDPHDYMSDVHDVDLSHLILHDVLDQALTALPGRKLVHTNASVRYAEDVLRRIGIDRHFEGIFDIAAADWLPKPENAGYEALRRRFNVDPTRSAMFEDMACNLKPAHEAGMMTVWVQTHNDWASDASFEAYIHHRTNDLPGWLAEFVSTRTKP
jgi:putative hydrolase of the HAD superfamily